MKKYSVLILLVVLTSCWLEVVTQTSSTNIVKHVSKNFFSIAEKPSKKKNFDVKQIIKSTMIPKSVIDLEKATVKSISKQTNLTDSNEKEKKLIESYLSNAIESDETNRKIIEKNLLTFATQLVSSFNTIGNNMNPKETQTTKNYVTENREKFDNLAEEKSKLIELLKNMFENKNEAQNSPLITKRWKTHSIQNTAFFPTQPKNPSIGHTKTTTDNSLKPSKLDKTNIPSIINSQPLSTAEIGTTKANPTTTTIETPTTATLIPYEVKEITTERPSSISLFAIAWISLCLLLILTLLVINIIAFRRSKMPLRRIHGDMMMRNIPLNSAI